jgi:hypothetical protein
VAELHTTYKECEPRSVHWDSVPVTWLSVPVQCGSVYVMWTCARRADLCTVGKRPATFRCEARSVHDQRHESWKILTHKSFVLSCRCPDGNLTDCGLAFFYNADLRACNVNLAAVMWICACIAHV